MHPARRDDKTFLAMSRDTFTDQDTTIRPPRHGEPDATEDLNIAEHLESIRVRDENRPGEECYRLENGGKVWVSEANVRSFLHEYGGDHPSDFFAATGKNWEEVLFSSKPLS
jgi:hypothetical protein